MQKGFSIIELLVVIVVIGIIVSFAVLGYSTYQRRAFDASVQSDLESISGELEFYRTQQSTTNPNNEFPRTKAQLDTLEIQAAKSNYDTTISYNMVYCIANSGTNAYQAYKLIAMSKSGVIFVMTQDGFESHSLTASSLTSNACTALGLGLVSNGMSGAGSWQTWVRNG